MLKGKVAVITGSSSGIGAEIAFNFAKEGADGITLHGRRHDALEATKKRLIDGGFGADKIFVVTGDITSENTHQKLVHETVNRFGRLDVLVNNAGMFKLDAGIQSPKEIFEANFFCLPALTKVALQALTQSKGTIINISTALSLKVLAGTMIYCASKAAMNHVTKATALELGPLGIRVNAIGVGLIPGTDIHGRGGSFTEEVKHQVEDNFKASVPLRRNGTTQDIANGATFLASDKASFITGTILAIDGGWHLT